MPTSQAPKTERIRLAGLGNKGRKRTTDVPWHEIRGAVEAGMSILKASKRWDVPYERARKRAQREHWSVPATIMADARERLKQSGVDVPIMSQSEVIPRETLTSGRENIGTALAENATEIAESASLTGLKLVSDLLKEAASESHKLAPLVDVKDISQAIRAVRMAGNLDKQGPVVSLSLWSGQPVPKSVPKDIVEVESWGDEG